MPAPSTAARYASILGVILVLGWLYLGLRLESWVNVVVPERLPEVGPRAEALHGTSFVADLHADSLLFGRDLLERGTMGHVDLPRLQEGGVALQVFSLPTIVPYGLNIESNEGDGLDMLTLAGVVQLSPTALLGPTGRALHAADRLADFAAASDGEFVVIDGAIPLQNGDAVRAYEIISIDAGTPGFGTRRHRRCQRRHRAHDQPRRRDLRRAPHEPER